MDLVERIRQDLAAAGGPLTSRELAARHLQAPVPDESLATRLLHGILAPAGLVYEPGRGWKPPPDGSPGPADRRWFAAVHDPATDEILVAEVSDSPGSPVPLYRAGLEDATVVLLDPRRDRSVLRRRLAAGGMAVPAALISMRTALRGGPRIPRDADLEAVCGLLGIRWLDSSDAAGAATALAACVHEVRRRLSAHEPRSKGPLSLPGTLTGRQLECLPEGPGVYRFYDEDGELLYVGKAKNLRRRVASYFRTPRTGSHGARFLPRVHRLEHETTGSELEAILREAHLIRRRAPAGNVQKEVHRRLRDPGTRVPAARVLLLPRPDRSALSAVVLSEERYVGHATIGPRGGGLTKLASPLEKALASGEATAPARETGASQLVASWLARHADHVSYLDLDGFTDADAASAAVREAARAVLAEPGPLVIR